MIFYKEDGTIMSDLYNKIESLCKDRKISITAMCKEATVSRGSLTDLKSGRSKELSTEAVTKIANYFGTTVDFLLGTEKNSTPPVQDERSAAIEFVKGLSESDFDRYSSVIKAVFPDKFEK